MKNNKLTELIKKYTSETLSEWEGKELAGMLRDQEHQAQLMQLLQDQLERGELDLDPADSKSWNNIQQYIAAQIGPSRKMAPVIDLRKRWWQYAAAALLCIVGVAYLWPRGGAPEKAITTNTNIPSNILPGKNKAVLVLGDKSVLDLDSLLPGNSVVQGNMQIVKTAEGQLIYSPASGVKAGDAIFINTMKTPNGGQYELTLPDGSQAWLNAASSITYPTRFSGGRREVTVSGEVYLEVKTNKSQPFIVHAGNQEITVLGTAFNISNYQGETARTSLVSGAIKINERILQPGQAFVNGNVQPTNIAQDIAWRSGVFNFNDQTLAQVMRQIERWYDVDVVYEGNIPAIEFTGELSRTLTLAEVVDFLRGSQINIDWRQNKLFIKK